MIKEFKKFISFFSYYIKTFKNLDRKTKEKSIMMILYLILFSILLKFPILLVREVILYFMTVYDLPNINIVAIITRIVVEVIYLFVLLIYFPKNFNQRVAKKYIVNKG